MENEKKKRKQKKKKNKQIRTSEDEMIVSESTSVDDTHMRNGKNDQNPISDTVDLPYEHSSGTKDAKLEDAVKHLHEENNLHIQKMADLELKLVECEGEKHSWLKQEAALVDKIRSLEEDKTALDLERARLLHTIEHLERDKASLILNEKSCRETIVDRNKDITRLHAQVVELEEQKRDLLQENKQLTENVADYQSKLVNLERKISSTYTHSSDRVTKETLSSQVDAACILVDKLITENAELIGKVNELFVELQRVRKTELSSGVEPDQMAEATDTSTFNDPEPPMFLNSITSSESLDALKSVPIHDHSIGSDFVNLDNDFLGARPSISTAAREIEQFPLHEIEDRNRNRELLATENDEKIEQIPLHEIEDGNRDRELLATENEEKDVVLSDAPLIGAPYRLISFMAKYITGADLVGES